MFTNEDVSRFAGGVIGEEEIRKDMPKWIRRAGNGTIGIWCIEDKITKQRYGTSGLSPLPIEQDDTDWDLLDESIAVDYEVEVGYLLLKSAWGRGIATEAARCMVEFGFEVAQLPEIVAVIDDENQASRNVLNKLGFREMGERRAYAETCVGFRITQAEFRAEFQAEFRS